MLTKIHHVGIVVRSIEAAYAFYCDTLSLPVYKEDIIQDQGVKAALLTIGESEIELLEPLDPDTGVARFLERRGEGLHHLCFATDDVARELEAARAKGLPLIDQQPRPGLAGMICFLHPKAGCGVLIEYAQP
jgi:methylmalonyl-CoA/ethylmalonyl-CoA epimerase